MPRIFIRLLILLPLACSRQLSPTQRENSDQKPIRELAQALSELPQSEKYPPYDPSPVQKEARLIAEALVRQTYETNQEFQMERGPVWHNYQIKSGVKQKGYCYHWVPELLKALPQQPMQYFERHWGASFLSMGRENNAVIITKRGAPLKTGIVYDAWRGVGRPFWKHVAEDKKYKWEQRFHEAQILMGEAHVQPKR